MRISESDIHPRAASVNAPLIARHSESQGWRLFLLHGRLDECPCFSPHLCLVSEKQVTTSIDFDEPCVRDSACRVAVDSRTRAVWIVDRTDDEGEDLNVLKRKGIDGRVRH